MSTLVTADQLAKQLSVSRDTIDRWERRGVIPAALRVPKRTPTGRGKGRTWVRWDLEQVLKALGWKK